jgi:hypothetical protein
MIELNSALDFTFFDDQGQVYKLRCGHVDVAHPNGWFGIYINNAMVYVTQTEPAAGIRELTNFAAVQKWAERVFDLIFIEWQNEGKPAIKSGIGYDEWKAELIKVTARATGQSEGVIKINDGEAVKWYNDGLTPYQCFRETWDMENDAGT